jgi:hypothetical protein
MLKMWTLLSYLPAIMLFPCLADVGFPYSEYHPPTPRWDGRDQSSLVDLTPHTIPPSQLEGPCFAGCCYEC